MSRKITKPFSAEIISIRDLLSLENVVIPSYQRPYKWGIKNVNDLIDDFFHFKSSLSYRLGTIVYHQEADTLNLVDGQQRSITLSLLALAIAKDSRLQEVSIKNKFVFPKNQALENFEFNHVISKENVRTNFREIQRRIVDFDYETLDFLFNRCEVVQIVLNDISEAFQFFDSQNARGKDLDPHDLLKAFHLREIGPDTSEEKVKEIVANWESLNSQTLAKTFADYLFRIRNWSKGKSARFFEKSHIDEFKGISPLVTEPYPFAGMYRITHFYLEGYNLAIDRRIDRNKLGFPFQIDQVIINGKRFFELAHHYIEMIQTLSSTAKILERPSIRQESVAAEILWTIEHYPARFRTGDQYVRNLFETALIYYLDKFGEVELERAIEKIFIWAYGLRLYLQSVQLASIDNHALEHPFVFKTLKEALKPADFLNISLNQVSLNRITLTNSSGKLDDIVRIFKKLNYLK